MYILFVNSGYWFPQHFAIVITACLSYGFVHPGHHLITDEVLKHTSAFVRPSSAVIKVVARPVVVEDSFQTNYRAAITDGD